MRYRNIIKNLVQRYVITRQKRDSEQNVVTVDDINELKQGVSSFRSELLQILRESGMKTKTLNDNNYGLAGKKNRFKERRLFKGFGIEFSESVSDSQEFLEIEHGRTLPEDERRSEQKNPFSEMWHPIFQKKKKIKNLFSKLSSKPSWESTDDLESDSKTPDSDIVDANTGKRVWFCDNSQPVTSSDVELYIDDLQPKLPQESSPQFLRRFFQNAGRKE